MEIRLNGKPLCHVAEAMLSDVYHLLGKHSFTFHLNKRNEVLDIVNPLQGCRVVLESRLLEITDRLLYPIRSILTDAGLKVIILESEEERKRLLNESGIWLVAVQDEGTEIATHYFFRHMKQGKKLANLLTMNMLKYSEVPIGAAGLKWKDRLNVQLTMSGQQWTTAEIAYGGFLRLSAEQLSELAYGIARAAAAYFTHLPVIDVMEKLRAMGAESERLIAQEEALRFASSQPDAAPLPEEVEITDDSEHEPEAISSEEDVCSADAIVEWLEEAEDEPWQYEHDNVLDMEHEPDHASGEMEEDENENAGAFEEDADVERNVAESVIDKKTAEDGHDDQIYVARDEDEAPSHRVDTGNISDNDVDSEQQQRQAPSHSVFTWLHTQLAKNEDGSDGNKTREHTSILSYMNQKSLTIKGQTEKSEPSFHLILNQRERKREQNRSSSDQPK
ncbi:hypothetical protein [Paenibacillus alvei]|uniref:Uncharacterized protein n=1 Tax=Paenibacillus alvei TaxID=44250 RepID=A0AAP6ZUF4_PAEAL|nr:hypothetical protein [Paenibacillus alvei]NOJ70383.1 hypothetical protein [Paenibacillus alvei]